MGNGHVLFDVLCPRFIQFYQLLELQSVGFKMYSHWEDVNIFLILQISNWRRKKMEKRIFKTMLVFTIALSGFLFNGHQAHAETGTLPPISIKTVTHNDWMSKTLYYSSNLNIRYSWRLTFIESGTVNETRLYAIKAVATDSSNWTVRRVTSSPKVGAKVGRYFQIYAYVSRGTASTTEKYGTKVDLYAN